MLNRPPKIKASIDRMVACVKGGEFRRDRIIKAGTKAGPKFIGDIDVCVTGAGAGMLLTELINSGILVETFYPEFAETRITVAHHH